jgi:hypothetical protein
MDIKVLAAVFVSLAAVFAGADGGMFSTSDVREVQSSAGLSAPSVGSLTKDLPFVGDFFQRPEPENDVQARIVADTGSKFTVRKGDLQARNLTTIKTQSMKVDSNEDISFLSFTGGVKFGNTTEIDGSASGLLTSDVNVSTAVSLKTGFETDRIEINNTQKTNLKFSDAAISPIDGSDFPIDTENEKIDVTSFTGDITIYPANQTLVIDGKVHSITAGKTSYGS